MKTIKLQEYKNPLLSFLSYYRQTTTIIVVAAAALLLIIIIALAGRSSTKAQQPS